jgi:hypothetical protein
VARAPKFNLRIWVSPKRPVFIATPDLADGCILFAAILFLLLISVIVLGARVVKFETPIPLDDVTGLLARRVLRLPALLEGPPLLFALVGFKDTGYCEAS